MGKLNKKSQLKNGFDDNISLQELEKLIRTFPSTSEISDQLIQIRSKRDFIDVKRGELYPEIIESGKRLRKVISCTYDINEIQAQVNFGCNGCIDTFISFIKKVELTYQTTSGFLVATPTYFRYYDKCDALQIKLIDVPFKENYEYPLDGVLEHLKNDKPSCLLLVTPNNPSGIPIKDKELFKILDNVSDDTYVAVDRTCVNIDKEISSKELLKKYKNKNLVIFHSFSKYHGMSHLRIGFSIFSNEDFASEVNRYIPFGLNLEAVLKATYILLSDGELKPKKNILENITVNKKIISEFIRKNEEYSCTDFKSNYTLLHLPSSIDSITFSEKLSRKGIYIMPGNEFPKPINNLVRIHTGGEPKFILRMIEEIEKW